MKILGIILIVLGILDLAYQGFSYRTRDTVFKAGPVKVEADENHFVQVPAVIGMAAIAGGVALLVAGARKPGL